MDDARVDKMLVQMVYVFNHPAVARTGDAQVVDYGGMLHVLAQAHAPGMRADGQFIFSGHQQHCQ